MSAFTVGELERLEEVICPRCGGSGEERANLMNPAIYDTCDVCNGERHIWRLRKADS